MTTTSTATKGSTAYSLAAWMRDLGSSTGQIADVLGVDTQMVPGLIGRARSIAAHPAADSRPTGEVGIAVFLDDGDDRVVDQAAALAKRQNAKLHLVARHKRVHHGTFALSASKMRKGAAYREEAEARLLDAARLAVHRGIDVVPHAIAGSEEDALRIVMEKHGAMVIVVDDREHRHLEKAARHLGAALRVTGSPSESRSPRARSLKPAFL